MIYKKGDMKWDIVIAMILGIIFLGLAMYMIYNEYFTSKDIDAEVCRQSVILRSNLPAVSLGDYSLKSFREEYPLKCKNNVVEITKKDVERGLAGEIIAKEIIECWSIFGNGDLDIFPSDVYNDGFWDSVNKIITHPYNSVCVTCSRISLSEEAKEYLVAKKEVIDIRAGLQKQMSGNVAYYNYIRDVGSKFSPFDFAGGMQIDLEADSFYIGDDKNSDVNFMNKLSGESIGLKNHFLGFDAIMSSLHLPKEMKPELGDLLVVYGNYVTPKTDNFGSYIPFLIYFQRNQNPNPLDILDNEPLIDFPLYSDEGICSSWEGIPA